MICDSSSLLRDECGIGFMIFFLDGDCGRQTSCLRNIKMETGYSASDLASLIADLVPERLDKRKPNYFVSDSAPVNKAAVRALMGDEGDESWFSCFLHFAQLAVSESVTSYLNGSPNIIIYDSDQENDPIEAIKEPSGSQVYSRIVSTCCAIRTVIKRSHGYANLFARYQNELCVSNTIIADVKTRFDSTLGMYESVLCNEDVLRRMQAAGRRDAAIWLRELYLSADDLDLMKSVTSTLEPRRDAAKELSAEAYCIGGVLLSLTSGIDAVARKEVSSRSIVPQESLVESLSLHLQTLLGYDGLPPCF